MGDSLQPTPLRQNRNLMSRQLTAAIGLKVKITIFMQTLPTICNSNCSLQYKAVRYQLHARIGTPPQLHPAIADTVVVSALQTSIIWGEVMLPKTSFLALTAARELIVASPIFSNSSCSNLVITSTPTAAAATGATAALQGVAADSGDHSTYLPPFPPDQGRGRTAAQLTASPTAPLLLLIIITRITIILT